MTILFEYNFTTSEIAEMLEVNPNIKELSDEDIKSLIDILIDLNCSESIIKNILISNPLYLNNYEESVKKLITKLKKLGITRLDITFDSNPFILNMETTYVDSFIEEKLNEGLETEEIIDLIDCGMIF